MKKLCLFFCCMMTLFTVQAQDAALPLGMNYQAIARDAQGNLLAGKSLQLRANLLAGGPDGKVAFSEVHQISTNENGLFKLIIGQGEVQGGDFATIPWGENNIWLEMAISDGADRGFTLLGSSQLLAVPYAYHAGSAETIHLHDHAEKGRCQITGLPFWSLLGNTNIDDECHFIGTIYDQDLVFKTNNIERLRITSDGTINIPGDVNIEGNLTVMGDGSFFNLNVENNLTVGKDGSFGQNLTVANQTSTNSLQVDATANVDGELTAKGRVVIEGGADGSQSEQDSYPLLVKGSTQGIAIEVNPATSNALESGRGNNYVSFWKNGAMTGRIEGMNLADLNPTGLTGLISTLVTNPPSGISYSFGNFSFPTPTVDVDASLDPLSVDVDVSLGGVNVSNPFGSLSQTLLNYIENPTTGPAGLIFNTFSGIICDPLNAVYSEGSGPEAVTNFKSQVLSNYTLDMVTNSISVFGSIVQLATSAGSVLDPEDIFSQAVALVVDISNLAITAGYADINLGVAYESGAGDYAEWLQRADKEEQLTYGDVVGVVGGKVSKKFIEADRFMVVSVSPIVLGNMPGDQAAEKGSEMIAFMGQVPVKVRGVVHIGDYLLPSGEGDGLAIAVAPDQMKVRDYQRIIGVAWDKSDGSKVYQLINTAVGLNQNDTGKMIEDMQLVINQMQLAIQEMNPNFQPQLFDTGNHTLTPSQSPGYSVSPTHSSRFGQYFEGKTYQSRSEMLKDVKTAMSEKANINLDEYPLVAYILDHADESPKMAAYYGQIQWALTEIMESQNR